MLKQDIKSKENVKENKIYSGDRLLYPFMAFYKDFVSKEISKDVWVIKGDDKDE